MRQKIMFLLAGMALGMALLSGGSALSAAVLTAVPSNHVFYVDGRQVSLTAYEIGGGNYLKLRDIGQAVGFNVCWDGTVQIESDKPYTGMSPVRQAPVPTLQTPAVLTEEYARSVLKTVRETYPSRTVYPAPYVPNKPFERPFSNCDKCAGWAMLCSDAVFGELPWRQIERPRREQIRIGDLVEFDNEFGGHVMVVTGKTDEYIKVTESGRINVALWGGQYFKWWLEQQPGYALWTRYPQ